MIDAACAYCHPLDEEVIWSNAQLRVLLVRDTPFTGWCRVVWNGHVKEMTDLAPTERDSLMAATLAVEEGLRRLLSPEKVNLASLGTAMPHVHWHVIPRFSDDSHFPEPIWGSAVRAPRVGNLPEDFVTAMRQHLSQEINSNERRRHIFALDVPEIDSIP